MPRSVRTIAALLLVPHLAVAAPPDKAAPSVQQIGGLVRVVGVSHCRITDYRLLRDGYETLIDNDFMARRTPGARVAITIACDP